jgi:hypothetical protein
MSTPDREPQAPGPLKYAPKWARVAAPAQAGDRPASGPRPANAHPPERKPASVRKPASEHRPALERGPALEHSSPERRPAAPPREPAPPWRLAKQRGTFEGDVAIKELRERMALAPDQPPEPPMRDDRGAVLGMVGRLAGLVALAAVAAYGFVWFSAPGDQGQGFASAAAQNAPFGQRAAPAVSRASLSPASLNGGSFKPAVFQPPAARAAMRQSRDEAPAVDRPQLLAPVPWPDTSRGPAEEPHETVATGAAPLAAVPAPNAAAPVTPAEAAIVAAPPPAAAMTRKSCRLFGQVQAICHGVRSALQARGGTVLVPRQRP